MVILTYLFFDVHTPLINDLLHVFLSSDKSIEKYCEEGSLKLEKDGTPMFFWKGHWSPICGHQFWNNQHGAKSFCNKLGYNNGKQLRTHKGYDEDAIRIGDCKDGESLEECTGGCNDKGVGDGNCSAGKNVGITITCDGQILDTFLSSCEGIPQITEA